METTNNEASAKATLTKTSVSSRPIVNFQNTFIEFHPLAFHNVLSQ